MLTQRLLLGSLVEPRAKSARTLRSGHRVQSRGFCSSLPDSAASRKEVMQGSGGDTEKQALKKLYLHSIFMSHYSKGEVNHLYFMMG